MQWVTRADTPHKDLTPELRDLEAIAEGLRLLNHDDHEQLTAEPVICDALYACCQHRPEF